MLEDTRRLAPAGIFPGGGLVWPCGEETERYFPLGDEQDLVRRFFKNVGTSPDDGADVIAFTNRYGLLLEDRPLTVAEFRLIQSSMAELIEEDSQVRDGIETVGRDRYYRWAQRRADWHSDWAPRFTMQLAPHPGRGKRGLIPQMVPDDLCSLVALQVTRALHDQSVQWRRCDECNGFFTVGSNGERGRKARYCSESHRTRHNERKRASKQEQAKETMRAQNAAEPCPYCRQGDEQPKRNAHHCGRPACRKRHSRANV